MKQSAGTWIVTGALVSAAAAWIAWDASQHSGNPTAAAEPILAVTCEDWRGWSSARVEPSIHKLYDYQVSLWNDAPSEAVQTAFDGELHRTCAASPMLSLSQASLAAYGSVRRST